jgi:hypothetical protein
MSRRFGRNQKRRMREQIAEAEFRAQSGEQRAAAAQNHADMLRTMLDLERGLMRETNDKLQTYKRFFVDVAHKVGAYATIAGVAPKRMGEVMFGPTFRWPVRQKMDFDPARFDSMSMASAVAIHDELMEVLSVTAVHDHFANQMHMRVAMADKCMGYSISRSALTKMSALQLADQIGPEITRALVEAIKGERR